MNQCQIHYLKVLMILGAKKIINPDMAIEVIHFVIIEFHSTLKINVLSINTPNHNVEKIIDNSMHVNCH